MLWEQAPNKKAVEPATAESVKSHSCQSERANQRINFSTEIKGLKKCSNVSELHPVQSPFRESYLPFKNGN